MPHPITTHGKTINIYLLATFRTDSRRRPWGERRAFFGHRMAHLSTIFITAGSSDTIRFGSLEFPTLLLVGMWVPPVFVPLQTFLFGSLDFVADRLGVLRLSEEALVPTSTRGGAPHASPGPLDDLNVETPTLRLEPTLGSNSTVSNVHIVLYSLFNTFC